MRLAVIGTKKFIDYRILSNILDKIPNIKMIISGGAIGTDTLAEKYAVQDKINFLKFPPNYKKYGDKAKHIRDKLIVEECDELIAFWDGECEGTKYTLDYAEQLGKPIKIVQVQITE